MAPLALVVDDSAALRLLARDLLRDEGIDVIEAADGTEGVALARRRRPDIVLLDLALPDLDGLEVCRQIRTFSDTYLIMVTGREEETDKVMGLSVGADDYVTKPFSSRELTARVAALLRRPRGGPPATTVRRIGDLQIDAAAHVVHAGSEPVLLTRTEFALLDALSERPGSVWPKDGLIERIWGPGWDGDPHVVEAHLSNLRRKLHRRGGNCGIDVIRGVGYRLVPAADPSQQQSSAA